MSITDIFVKRPVLAICVNLIVLVAGLKSIDSLPTRQYPKSDMSVVKVSTAYVGASADLVRGFVTTPLEKAIASADGIDYLDSVSSQGRSVISAHLLLNYDVGKALTQIQAKVQQVRNDLPASAELSIIEVESSDSRFASMYIGFYSDVLRSNQITDYLTRVVQPKLSSVLGVQKADILGANDYAMRVWLKPDRLAALNLSPLDVQEALKRNNYLSAVGSTKGEWSVTTLTSNTDLQSVPEFKKLVVRSQGGKLVYLEDIAEIELGSENYDEEVRFDGKRATFMGVWVLPDANSLEVMKKVRALLPDIEKNLPEGLSVAIPYDSTLYIQDAISEVGSTLLETILIVVIVIFAFMGSLRSVLVPVVAIPLSLIGAVGIMAIFGFTINLLTLLAIVLAVGLVVDDAIVMLENIERNLKSGLEPLQAGIQGARELVGPVIAMTITLAAVYAPIGIQGGLTGTLFKEFAFTLAGAVLVSGFVALTLSPMMASRLLANPKTRNTKLQIKIDATFNKLKESYDRNLRKALSIRTLVLATSGVLILIIPFLYMFSQKELAPREDQGVVFGIVQGSPYASIEQTTAYTELVQEQFKSFPEYDVSFQITRPAGGFSGFRVVPWSERNRTTQEIANEAWGKMSAVPGIQVIVTTPPPLPGGSNFPVEMTVQSTDDLSEMLEFAKELVGTAFDSGFFMHADTNLKIDLPQAEIVFDRAKLASLGVDLQTAGTELAAYLGGNYTNRFSIAGRSYKVIPQVTRDKRLTADQLDSLYISTSTEQKIPLSTVAQIKHKVEPRELHKFQQLNSFTIQGVPRPGASADEALSVLEAKAAEILPYGYTIDYPGESRQLRSEGNSLMATLLLSFVFIYLVLAAQFESFRDPFIILFGSVPLALAGALIFPFLGFTTMNIYSQVGLVTLVGLVAKNGILIVEFANVLKEQGYEKFDAVVTAAGTRLRPILMTSVATVAGHFPLILASGAGAEARNSIGIVLVSGMFIGTFFTLFVVPAIYLLISKPTPNDHLEAQSIPNSATPLKSRIA